MDLKSLKVRQRRDGGGFIFIGFSVSDKYLKTCINVGNLSVCLKYYYICAGLLVVPR